MENAIVRQQLVSLHLLARRTHRCIRQEHTKNVEYASARTHKDRVGKKEQEHDPTLATNIHFLLSFLFAYLFDEIEVAMAWLDAAGARTSASPRGDAV